jgi:hypothetical protein
MVKNFKIISNSACLCLLLGAVPVSLGWAAAIQTEADVYGFGDPALAGPPCGSQILGVEVIGNKIHLSLLNHGLVVSEDPRLTGQVTNYVEVEINNVNGHVGGHGSFILESWGYEGAWEADFNISAPMGKTIDLDTLTIVKDSQINARGTGEFAGMWYFFEHGLPNSPPPYDIPVEDPDGPGGCEFGEVWTGRILDPYAE